MSWLSPTNKVIWMKAFRKRETKVTIEDGRRFTVKYEKDKYGDELVKIRPEQGFVPTGSFKLKTVIDENWLTAPERYGGTIPTGESPYATMMRDFLVAPVKGVEVTEHWPHLMNRQVATLRSAFMRARTDIGQAARKVEVMRQDGKLYLIKG